MTKQGMVLFTHTQFKKVTAYCGCKSRLLYYQVTELPDIEGGVIKLERLRGLKNTRTAAEMPLAFIISSDVDITYKGKLEIEVGCQSPD